MDKAQVLYFFLSPWFSQVPCLHHLMPTLLNHLLFISDQRRIVVVLVFHGEKGCEPKRDVQLKVELHRTERTWSGRSR